MSDYRPRKAMAGRSALFESGRGREDRGAL